MLDPAESRKTVLVVEDEEVLRAVVVAGLEERFCVSQAADGMEAVKFLATHRADLVLTDLLMPRMDGLRLIQAIRERWPETKVVLCTRDPLGEECQQAQAFEIDAFIEKPFTLEEVTGVIDRLLEGSSGSTIRCSSHMPLREGKITYTDCHSPHGTATPALLVENSINENY